MIVEKVQEERDVTFLVNPTASFVSLVPRGANQIPFRIVKSQRGAEMNTKVLHKLIIPKDVDVEAVKKSFTEDTRDLLNLEDGICSNKFRVFEQYPAKKCQQDTFEVVTLDEELGVRAIQASPVEEPSTNLIKKMFVKTPVSVITLDNAPALDAEVVKTQYVEGLHEEIWGLSDAVAAIAEQEMGEGAAKLEAIKTVVANFLAFVEEAINVTKSDLVIPARAEKADDAVVDAAEDAADAGGEAGGDVAEENAEVGDAVGEAVEKAEKAVAVTPPTLDDVLAVLRDVVTPIQKSVSDLTETVTGLSEGMAGLQDQVVKVEKSIPIVVDGAHDGHVVRKSETPNGADIFRGIFG
jgi:hypothetical protein